MSTTVDDREVRRGLAALQDFGPKAIAEALNKTAFELREAEASEANRAFLFAGSATQSFLANPRTFLFEGAKPDRLTVIFHPTDRGRRYFSQHVTGGTIEASDDRHLALGDELAIPVGVKRSGRGRVPKGQTPSALVMASKGGGKRKRTVFVAGRAVLQRLKGGAVRVLYALAPMARLEKRMRYHEVAVATVRREFPRKARDVWAKFNAKRVG